MSIRHRADKNTQFLKTPFVMFNCLCEKRNLNATNIDKHMPNLAETFHSLHEQKDILILPMLGTQPARKLLKRQVRRRSPLQVQAWPGHSAIREDFQLLFNGEFLPVLSNKARKFLLGFLAVFLFCRKPSVFAVHLEPCVIKR